MLGDHIKKYIAENLGAGEVSLFTEEKDYAEKNQLDNSLVIVEIDPNNRFSDAYIERCDKETENMIRQEDSSFLAQPLVYLNKHKNEFIYLESKWFDFIRVDAVSLELDDVFKTYDVMLGLKLQKKVDQKLREYLNLHLQGEGSNFDLMFNADEGLWSLNFTLNNLERFNEDLTIGEAYRIIYHFLFQLIETLETE